MKANLDKEENNFFWKIVNLPSVHNNFSKKIKLMHRYKNYPWPINLIAVAAKLKIKKELELSKVDFNYDFNCLFGNLKGGGSVWFTNTYILDYAPIYFGNNITIGPDVKLITSTHLFENFNIVKAKPIHIEDNVWITMNVIILPGVRIGKNSVIGAGAVVTKNIPPNSLVAGNPARVIKELERDYQYWNELSSDIASKTKVGILRKIFN